MLQWEGPAGVDNQVLWTRPPDGSYHSEKCLPQGLLLDFLVASTRASALPVKRAMVPMAFSLHEIVFLV